MCRYTGGARVGIRQGYPLEIPFSRRVHGPGHRASNVSCLFTNSGVKSFFYPGPRSWPEIQGCSGGEVSGVRARIQKGQLRIHAKKLGTDVLDWKRLSLQHGTCSLCTHQAQVTAASCHVMLPKASKTWQVVLLPILQVLHV